MPCMATTMRCPDCGAEIIAKVSWGAPPTKDHQTALSKLILAAHQKQGCEGKEIPRHA